jgi:diguanylate cyclase (GGDEF)-like protein
MKASPNLKVQFVAKLICAVAVLTYCISGGAQQFQGHWLAILLIVGIEVAAQTFPFAILHAGARDEFTADMMGIVAAALLLPTRTATLALASGYVLGYVVRRDMQLGRIDDIDNQSSSAFLAISIAHLFGQPGLGWNSIVGASIGAMVYETLGVLVTSTWSVTSKHAKFWPLIRSGMTISALAAPWLICLGVLLGVIGWHAPWALPLMSAPLALVFMASRSRVKATEDRNRLDGLLKATTTILAATTVAGVTDAATTSASLLFENAKSRIDSDGPADGELSAHVTTERLGVTHLVVAAHSALLPAYTEHDQLLLETLASVTASALDKAALHEDVTEQATRDALTGLVNRRTFEGELRTSMIGHRSTDASGVMFLDLDGFKKINDEHGHKAGDEVLVETARRLLSAVRGGDTVARLGGDEFTVLLRGVHNQDEAVIVAERILATVRESFRLSTGVEVHPTPSLGIALATDRGTDPAQLLKDADAAMYQAKRAGKDCWRLAGDPGVAVVSQ